MNFFKEYYSERQIVPTGNGCIKSAQNGSETVPPGISAFNHRPFLIHHFIKEVLFRMLSISSVRRDISDDYIFVKRLSKRPGIKAGISVIEYTVKRNPISVQLKSYAVHALLYLIKISMITFLRFGHRQRQSLSICKINRIGCLAFLPQHSPPRTAGVCGLSMCDGDKSTRWRYFLTNRKNIFSQSPSLHHFL